MRNPYVMSHREFARQNVMERIHIIMAHSATGITSGTVEVILAELVREQMVELARQRVVYRPQTNLLRRAIELTKSGLQERLDGDFDFEPYFEVIRDKLKESAKEIAYLQEQLTKTQRQQIGTRTRFDDAEVPFEINEIGLINALEGLVAIPLAAEGCYLNIVEVRHSHEVEETEDEEILFPFHIRVEELVFIVDDDGSIFISTGNFPARLVEEAKETLECLARQLYIEG